MSDDWSGPIVVLRAEVWTAARCRTMGVEPKPGCGFLIVAHHDGPDPLEMWASDLDRVSEFIRETRPDGVQVYADHSAGESASDILFRVGRGGRLQ